MSVEQKQAHTSGQGTAGEGRSDPRRLTQRAFDAERAARDETLFALANGTLGVRGALEEDDSPSDGTFLSSVFEQNPIHYHERFPGFTRSTDTRVPVAEGKHLRLQLGDTPLRLQEAEWLDFERTLDLAAGTLERRLRLKTAQGHTLEIRARRVVPLAERALLAIRFEVASIDYAGPLTLCSSIETGRQAVEQGDDPRIGVHGGKELHVADEHADAGGARLTQRTHHSGVALVCAQQHRLSPGLVFTVAQAGGGRVEQRFGATLTPGASVVIEKYVAYDDGNGQAQDGVDAVLVRALRVGFDGIAAVQADALHAFWQRAGLSVEGDAAAELALRFNLFHLLQSAGRDGINGTAAKGITGEGYEGHCFWDTEAFVLPVMAFTAPDVARAMLMYRFRTLDGARDTARAMNHPRGALYPGAPSPAANVPRTIPAARRRTTSMPPSPTGSGFISTPAMISTSSARLAPRFFSRPRASGRRPAISIRGSTVRSASTRSRDRTNTPRWSTTTGTPTAWPSGTCGAPSLHGPACPPIAPTHCAPSPAASGSMPMKSRSGSAPPTRCTCRWTRRSASIRRTTISSPSRAGRFPGAKGRIARCCSITTRSPCTGTRSASRPTW